MRGGYPAPNGSFTTRWLPGDEIAFATKKGVMRGLVVYVKIEQSLDTTFKPPVLEPPRITYYVRSGPKDHMTNYQVREQHTGTTLDEVWDRCQGALDFLE